MHSLAFRRYVSTEIPEAIMIDTGDQHCGPLRLTFEGSLCEGVRIRWPDNGYMEISMFSLSPSAEYKPEGNGRY